jgi:SAM-dependent methyltransferase
MIVTEFRYLTRDDMFDKKYIAWSRIYEYPYVLNMLKNLGANKNSMIHNTSWGWEGCHVTFKDDLDNLYCNTLHSDIKLSNLNNTTVYDITKPPGANLIEQFDFVLNISTVEEVNYSHLNIIQNLLKQVKSGGYLIITFDYNPKNPTGVGSIQLSKIEEHFNIKLYDIDNKISGINSENIEKRNQNLNCGVLVIQK